MKYEITKLILDSKKYNPIYPIIWTLLHIVLMGLPALYVIRYALTWEWLFLLLVIEVVLLFTWASLIYLAGWTGNPYTGSDV